jgi:hypothetical protein
MEIGKVTGSYAALTGLCPALCLTAMLLLPDGVFTATSKLSETRGFPSPRPPSTAAPLASLSTCALSDAALPFLFPAAELFRSRYNFRIRNIPPPTTVAQKSEIAAGTAPRVVDAGSTRIRQQFHHRHHPLAQARPSSHPVPAADVTEGTRGPRDSVYRIRARQSRVSFFWHRGGPSFEDGYVKPTILRAVSRSLRRVDPDQLVVVDAHLILDVLVDRWRRVVAARRETYSHT